MKASDGNEDNGGGNNGGGRSMVMRVKGKGRWQGDKSDRDGKKRVMAWKRAMVRAARAMATETRARASKRATKTKRVMVTATWVVGGG